MMLSELNTCLSLINQSERNRLDDEIIDMTATILARLLYTSQKHHLKTSQ